jgi:hypothetical protein
MMAAKTTEIKNYSPKKKRKMPTGNVHNHQPFGETCEGPAIYEA